MPLLAVTMMSAVVYHMRHTHAVRHAFSRIYRVVSRLRLRHHCFRAASVAVLFARCFMPCRRHYSYAFYATTPAMILSASRRRHVTLLPLLRHDFR